MANKECEQCDYIVIEKQKDWQYRTDHAGDKLRCSKWGAKYFSLDNHCSEFIQRTTDILVVT